MRIYPFSVPSICESACFTGLGDGPIFKSKIIFLTLIFYFIAAPMLSFNSNLPRCSKNFISWANLVENLISYVFETISEFCSSHRLNSMSTFRISRIHDNFSLESIHGLGVKIGTLSPWSEKPKFQSALFSTKFKRSFI